MTSHFTTIKGHYWQNSLLSSPYSHMLRINIHDAKTHLSRYLAKLRSGEKIILCNRNIPLAEIKLLPRPLLKERPLGLARGEVRMTAAFFKSIPKSLLLRTKKSENILRK